MEITVMAGSPDEAEIAALVVALRARGSAEAPSAPARVPAWRDPARRLGVVRDWRGSGLPR